MRRMFSNRIAKSAKFLQMPLEAQALYFHSVLNADDDGVVEIYPLTKLLSTSPDVLKILLVKNFLTILNEDQVMLVNNWLEHNKIRPDRKIDSIYKHLIPKRVELLEPKPRSDVQDNSKRISGQSTDGISKDRLGKDKLSKDNILSAKADEEWNFKNYLNEMSNDKNRYIQIIGYFFEKKKLKFENKEQTQAAIKRHLRAAKDLMGFHASKVDKAMNQCEMKYKDIGWTLETCLKELTK